MRSNRRVILAEPDSVMIDASPVRCEVVTRVFGGLMMLYSGNSIVEWINARLIEGYRATKTGRLVTTPEDASDE